VVAIDRLWIKEEVAGYNILGWQEELIILGLI
jgi:hypothetical protein